MADECEGNILVKNGTFKDYIRQGEKWNNYIKYKEKNLWITYTLK
jgi:hypothetical protein